MPPRGFRVLPRRWVVERTFSWFTPQFTKHSELRFPTLLTDGTQGLRFQRVATAADSERHYAGGLSELF